MQRATDAEIDLFRALLEEQDEAMAALMAEVLGIRDEVVDLVAGETGTAEAVEPSSPVRL